MRKIIYVFLLFVSNFLFAQNPQVNLQLGFEIPFNFAYPALTIEHDQQARDYIYVAAKEQGLLIYDISGTPNKVKNITKNQLDTLDVMSVTQNGNYLYLALGNSFTNPEYPGMAIIDVSNPNNAYITDIWKQYSGSKKGGGIVKVEGNYAYFGAMASGLIVFDISDKRNIKKVSQLIPNMNFPDNNPDPAKYNARGMSVKNGIVYLCCDAGGIRIINCNDKQNPKETGKYSNPAMNGKPRAYNM
ncbi:MAG: LVIVD repeat-containing protein [Flavobacteriales bacterium]